MLITVCINVYNTQKQRKTCNELQPEKLDQRRTLSSSRTFYYSTFGKHIQLQQKSIQTNQQLPQSCPPALMDLRDHGEGCTIMYAIKIQKVRQTRIHRPGRYPVSDPKKRVTKLVYSSRTPPSDRNHQSPSLSVSVSLML